MADEMTVIDASGLTSIDYAQYLTEYFSTIGTAAGQTTYYGGPNSGPSLGYISGTQLGVRYSSTTNDRQVLMAGTDIQYDGIDGIHHGTYSGDVDSVTFGSYDAGTAYTQTETSRGELTGVITGLLISNLDISTDIGTPTGAGNATKTLMDTLKNAGITTDGVQANIQKLYEIFAARAQHFIGSDGNDTYVGTAFGDLIDGGLGNDAMTGGLGDDTYVVDSRTDTTTEAVDGGNDTIQTAISHFLIRENIENLLQLGTEDLFSYGNDLGNTITGNSGNSTLIGQGGADTLIGGLGNDTYYLDAEDTIVELDGEGTADEVVTDLDNYALADFLENLMLSGSGDDEIPDSDLNGSGNALNNTLLGNNGINHLLGLAGTDTLYGGEGNDVLDGGADADAMSGGEGDDAYLVDAEGDTVTEFDVEGKDTVSASVNFALSDFVEKLKLTGSANLDATGNGEDNLMAGNGGANRIWGLDGADIIKAGQGADRIYGGLGTDSLTGGGGADTFFFKAGETSASKAAADTISDFKAWQGDLIDLHGIDANGNKKGNQDFDFIREEAFSGQAGELRLEKTATDTYLMGDTNSDGKADFTIHFDGAFNLKEDFFVL
ncbi:MAG: Rhizobiocin/RTX toxin and hemolysin-type calcium binding protein [Rhizobium sp.]|nr:Rhizobiocin/RTX toxin and hemolysin-type calcium binding protein [Rhizobium sp.]